MLKTVNDVVNRIVEYYKPEKVILYGSYNTKNRKKGSDIDLLIVKDTDSYLIERLVEVERLLSDRTLPVDIMVYTPEEMGFLFSIGSPFIEEVLEKGRFLYMGKATDSWIKEAKDELDSATILYDHGKYRGACCHSQQSVETGLKALILERGRKPERIHDIVELLNDVIKQGWSISLTIDDAIFLNSIYKGMYPTEEGLLPHGESSREDTERAISDAKKIIAYVKNFFDILFSLLGLVLVSPNMLVLAFLIKKEDGCRYFTVVRELEDMANYLGVRSGRFRSVS